MFHLLEAATTSGTRGNWKERPELREDRIISQQNTGHGLVKTRPLETLEHASLTPLSSRYRTTEPFSSGISRTLIDRPTDCVCTWVPVGRYPGGIGALFDLKYPNRDCRHHGSLVSGRMVLSPLPSTRTVVRPIPALGPTR